MGRPGSNGRLARGPLSPSEVEQLHKLHDSGMSTSAIAREMNLSASTVSRRTKLYDESIGETISENGDKVRARLPVKQVTDHSAVLVHRPGAPSEVHFQSEEREALRELAARYGVEPVKVKKTGRSGVKKAASVPDADWDWEWEDTSPRSKPLWRVCVPANQFHSWSTRDLPTVTEEARNVA